MKVKYSFLAVPMALLCWGCSNADSSSGNEDAQTRLESSEDSVSMDADSSRVLVYSYDKFLTKNDVEILNTDTSRISVDEDFALSVDTDLPRQGNVLVVWDNKKRLPFYLRVASVKEESDRIVLDVDKATPFEALPSNSELNLSSEIYIDGEKLNANGADDAENSLFYDEANNTYHPVVIYQGQDYSDDNEENFKSTELSKNAYDAAFVDGVLDLREALRANFDWERKTSFAGYDCKFTPGAFAIPGLGSMYGDFQGGMLNFFKGPGALDKAFRKNAGNSYQAGILDAGKGYIRVDSLKIKNQVNFRLFLKTTWYGRLENFGLNVFVNGGYEISNIGGGIGAGVSGEKQLTHWPGFDVVFYIGPVPIAINFKPNFYFKYNLEAYGLFNYDLRYKYTMNDTVGFEWTRGKGFSDIKKVHHESSYNKAKDLRDFISKSNFIVNGTANVGLYFRVPVMFYYAAGPTIGIGLRGDIESKVGGTILYDESGNLEKFDPTGSIKIDGAIPLEVGGEVDILGVKVFSRAYDVWDIGHWNILDLNVDKYK